MLPAGVTLDPQQAMTKVPTPWQTEAVATRLSTTHTLPMNLSILTTALVLAVTLAPANAQISVDTSLNALLVVGDPGPTGEQVVASFDASGSDKLVVVVSSEHAFGITSAFSIDGAEYNGRAMIEAVQENTLPGATALYYLDNPGPAGEIRVFMGMKNGGLVTIYAVSGTATGVDATGQSTTASVGITTTSANSLVIAGILDGGQASNGNGADAPTADVPLTEVHSAVWGINLWGGHGSGYQLVASPGPVAPSFTTLGTIRLRTVGAAFGPDGNIGMNYCAANANSTGSIGSISVAGSATASDNDITLTAPDLPTFSWGFFITSQTPGFVANPGGSQGNLCLSGAIGRYVGPGQIKNSGASGSFSLAIDLTATPTPTGFVTIMGGETWNFQCWHRDAVAGMAVSNFTDAVRVDFQ